MRSLNTDKVKLILEKVVQWASHRTDIFAVALVGSWARGAARADSDIDLMFLTDAPSAFRQDETWINEIKWKTVDAEIANWKDEDYGVIWSRHVYFSNGAEIEFGFGFPSWASINPIDAGTFRVVNDGCQILYDPENLLSQLIDQVQLNQTG